MRASGRDCAGAPRRPRLREWGPSRPPQPAHQHWAVLARAERWAPQRPVVDELAARNSETHCGRASREGVGSRQYGGMRRLRPRPGWLRLAWSRWAAVWIALALLLYVAAALTLPPLVVDYDGVDGDARAQAIASARQGVLLLGGGVLAGLTLLFTWRRDTLSRDANFTDRYTEAIAQLGNESVAIRLGGVYALERIARDSIRDRGTILDVLAAYLRHHSPLPASTSDDDRLSLGVDLGRV